MSKTEQLDYLDALLMHLPDRTVQQYIEAAENEARFLGPTLESLDLSRQDLDDIAQSDLEIAQGLGISFAEAEVQTNAFLATLK